MSSLSLDQEQQIKEMLAADNKIAAIKLYREITGVGLAEAKNAVEAVQRGESLEIPAAISVDGLDSSLENRIKHYISQEKKIEAIKIYQEAYKCGLKEAKGAVDLIQANMHREGYSGMPVTPPISNDPFAEDKKRNRSCLILILAIVLVAIGVVVYFYLTETGF